MCFRKKEIPNIELLQEKERELNEIYKALEVNYDYVGEWKFSCAIDRIKHLCNEENLLYHDTLTGAYTRYWYEQHIKDCYTGTTKNLYIGFADVNGLHKINEEQGHEAGDKAIKAVYGKLKQYGDVVRFGGDEFILISHNSNCLYLNKQQNLDFAIAVVHKTHKMTVAEAQNKADKLMLKIKENK